MPFERDAGLGELALGREIGGAERLEFRAFVDGRKTLLVDKQEQDVRLLGSWGCGGLGCGRFRPLKSGRACGARKAELQCVSSGETPLFSHNLLPPGALCREKSMAAPIEQVQ